VNQNNRLAGFGIVGVSAFLLIGFLRIHDVYLSILNFMFCYMAFANLATTLPAIIAKRPIPLSSQASQCAEQTERA
jgi:hypothetical protein